uniref:Thioredoxin domain-containing protein n=1 Tax=Meloidogyne hapla TaxID=6305 RepID=A0A1I8BRP9_MELHA
MLSIRFSNFIKRTVSSFTALFGQQTKMNLLMDKNYLPQSVNFRSFKRFEILPKRSFSVQAGEQQTIFDVDSDDGFDELILNSGKPVIACFHADWCGPCQSFTPRLEAKVAGQGAKINVEGGASSLAEQFEVVFVPTIVCFRDGEFFDRFEGAVEDSYLDNLLEDLLMSGEEEESVRE